MIVHLVPTFTGDSAYGAGNWKAVAANRLALAATGLNVREIPLDPKSPLSCLEQLPDETRHVLLEYTWWPQLVARIRGIRPEIRIHVRAHNAEAYQHFHRNRIYKRDYIKPALYRRCVQLAQRDAGCKKHADNILGISDWDNRFYWNWLFGSANVGYLPYFSPWPYVRSEVAPPAWEDRQHAIVSMGGNFDPSGIANFQHFDIMSQRLTPMLREKWDYVLTWWSQWHEAVPKVGSQIRIERSCEQPWDLLCQSRALAVLTHLGFGFKTTVLDGLAAGCHVILHPILARRLPQEVRELCLIYDPESATDAQTVAHALNGPPKQQQLNAELFSRVRQTLHSLCS
ncbi:MAG: hypothetical protein H6994_11740 [Pseudomonadales bacterium]|nr:hypothetical protein [Pseudomonadales bacterium]